MASNQKSENRQPPLFLNFDQRGGRKCDWGPFDILYILSTNLKVENSIEGTRRHSRNYNQKLAKNMEIKA